SVVIRFKERIERDLASYFTQAKTADPIGDDKERPVDRLLRRFGNYVAAVIFVSFALQANAGRSLHIELGIGTLWHQRCLSLGCSGVTAGRIQITDMKTDFVARVCSKQDDRPVWKRNRAMRLNPPS